MQPTIQTPFGPKTLHVCKDGTTENEDWIHIYEVSFPESQRQDLDDLRRQLHEGTMELDETRDQDETILCMTITEVFRSNGSTQPDPQFLLACYTAVVPEMRSLGIGSIHRSRLGELLKSEYPDFIGIFSEIESTRETGLEPDAMETRIRRKRFFLKNGLLPLDVHYPFPNYIKGGHPVQGELLWLPFGKPAIDRSALAGVVRRIYVEGYGLADDDPFIGEVLEQFRS